MLEEYIYHGQEKLRCGYTTGSCAVAAAKAALAMLLSGNVCENVSLMTPKGIMLYLDVLEIDLQQAYVSCAVKKDAGDDPDITDGVFVYAKVSKCDSGILIDGGEGVGRVTKEGLDQPVGNAAINSTPRRLMREMVMELSQQYHYDGGVQIIISVPGGEALAKKTFNPRLGISGGISIIGTSGIVEPMSTQALLDTIALEMRQRRAQGDRHLILTLGNYSQRFLVQEMPDIQDKSVKCSNYIGQSIDMALQNQFESILIVGHIGKLVKLGAGIMNTHSKEADGRMEVIVTCGVIAGVRTEILKKIPSCVTVDEALGILDREHVMAPVMDVLLCRIQYYLDAKVRSTLPVGAVLFSNTYGMLGCTQGYSDIKKLGVWK